MGRDWYWSGNRSSKNGGKQDKDSLTTNPSGCMCSVFQLFDFHQFQFPNSNQHHPSSSSLTTESFLPEDPPPKGSGAEAPRNSLELDQPPLLSTVKPDECLHIPMGIQIKTNGDSSSKGANDSSSSEISSSPSTKTPNLVARLMGLDILPDQCHSPTSILTTPTPSRKSHQCGRRPSNYSGTRSLPETPRMSSARKSDVEHRLSLQINKENTSPSQELFLSPFSSLKRKELKCAEEENRSPGHYARQIVKQVKETVSRRVGLGDITNTVKRRDSDILNQLKSKKITATKLNVNDEYSYSYSSPNKAASCSPRLKFSEPKNKDHYHNNMISPPPLKAAVCPPQQKTKPKLQHEYGRYHHQQKRPKVAEERFGPQPRLKKPPQTTEIIRNKKEEAFVRTPTATRPNIPDKKLKKSPLSNDLNSPTITIPTLLPVKKDPIPPATKIPLKQALPNAAQESKRSSQLSSCTSHSYKQQETTHNPDPRGKDQDKSNGAVSAITGVHRGGLIVAAEEFEYITRILKRTGLQKDSLVSFSNWFSPSHPIDPSIFHYLEYFLKKDSGGQLSHRCNRKLIFHLVDEILAEILKPYLKIKPWVNSWSGNLKGADLIDVLCSKVRGFPSADCRVLDDIDALIDKDMPPALKVQSEMAFEEEGEGIVMEVEKDILDTLVHETAAFLFNDS